MNPLNAASPDYLKNGKGNTDDNIIPGGGV